MTGPLVLLSRLVCIKSSTRILYSAANQMPFSNLYGDCPLIIGDCLFRISTLTCAQDTKRLGKWKSAILKAKSWNCKSKLYKILNFRGWK